MYLFANDRRRPPHSLASLLADVPGRPLEPEVRAFMEPRFGHDFSMVRVHTDAMAADAARAVEAAAWTVGRHIAFASHRYQPGTDAGRRLLAHELAHVVQQRPHGHDPSGRLDIAGSPAHETAADRAAAAVSNGSALPTSAPVPAPAISRKVEMRDVGPGEQSGVARLPELVNRLNAMATGVTFTAAAGAAAGHQVRDSAGALVPAQQAVELTYTVVPGQTPGYFERQLMALIDLPDVLPLRLTSRRGRLGSHAGGFPDQVDADAWTSGYVDIDDLLASSDLGLQSVLLHFVTERAATPDYGRRIGSAGFTPAEFSKVHRKGTAAEEELLRTFFDDHTIELVADSPSPTVRRVFRNSRKDVIRRRVRGAQNINASTIEVITKEGDRLTPDEYREKLRREERARAIGESAHRAGPHNVPAP